MKNKVFITEVRVEYSHTDRMEYVHHSQYLVYYEKARWELFRSIGLCYREIENCGIIMPVVSAKLKYCNPAFYDEILRIRTKVKLIGARLIFTHIMTNEAKEIINRGEIQVAFVDNKTRKPIRPIREIMQIVKKYV